MARMRTLLLLFCFSQLALARPTGFIDLDYHQEDLVRVLRKLERQLGYNLYVGPEVQGTVTLTARHVPVDGVIALVLKMQSPPYEWRQVGNTVVIGSPEKMRRFGH